MLGFIALDGIAAFLFGAAMVAVGGVGALVEGVLALVRPARRARLRLALVGPALYAGIGALLVLAVEADVRFRWARALDVVAPVLAGVGLVLWAVGRVALHVWARPAR